MLIMQCQGVGLQTNFLESKSSYSRSCLLLSLILKTPFKASESHFQLQRKAHFDFQYLTVINNTQNKLKITINCNRSQQNYRITLKIGNSVFFGMGKPIMKSEIQNFEIPSPFVTSRAPKMTQNSPKIALYARKLDKMIDWI